MLIAGVSRTNLRTSLDYCRPVLTLAYCNTYIYREHTVTTAVPFMTYVTGR